MSLPYNKQAYLAREERTTSRADIIPKDNVIMLSAGTRLNVSTPVAKNSNSVRFTLCAMLCLKTALISHQSSKTTPKKTGIATYQAVKTCSNSEVVAE